MLEPYQAGAPISEAMMVPGADELQAWRRLGISLLDMLAASALTLPNTSAESFRQRLAEVTAQMGSHPGAPQILTASGSINRIVQSYFVEIQRLLGAQPDPPCSTALRHKEQAPHNHSSSVIPVPGTAPASRSPVDLCTGLPLKADLESALERALFDEDSSLYVGVFYVHRIALTNARFGTAIADQVLLFCSQHIATRLLRPEDLLFRWQGPAFAALLRREESLPAIANEVQRTGNAPLSRFFETASRSVYLPIKMSAETFRVEEQSAKSVLEQVEEFAGKIARTMD
jgi:GGDEF domain-containing protein